MKSKKPIVTVVVTCFNYADYVGHAIRSVYSQIYPDIQLIVVNDGSTDNSHKVINGLQNKYKFEYLSHKNVGVIESINRAVEKTKGEYFIHLGADDIMPDNYLEALVAAALNNPDTSIFYTDLVNLDTDEVVVEPPVFSKELLKHYNFIHGTSMVNTGLMRDIDYDDNLRGLGLEDWDFFLTAVLQGEKAMYVDSTFLRYRRHETLRSRSQRRRSDGKGLKAIKYILEKNINKYPEEMGYFWWLKDNINDGIAYLDTYSRQIEDQADKIKLQGAEINKLKVDLDAIINSKSMRYINFIKKYVFFWRSYMYRKPKA